MGYTAATDFLALLRNTGGGVRMEQMPGLDWVVSALARAGFINLSISATAPTVNQAATAWFQPATPSWSAEGQLFLWNAAAAPPAYQLATPALWSAYFIPVISGYTFQSVAVAAAAINAGVTLCAVQRNAPAATALILPNLAAQFGTGKKLQIVDFSTGVTNHTITLTTPDSASIMQNANWQLLTVGGASFGGIMLQPSPDLNSWIIAP